MSKGAMVEMFKVGDFITYKHDSVPGRIESGRICRLHKSGSLGVAEIKPSNGSCKVSRRLQHVYKVRA